MRSCRADRLACMPGVVLLALIGWVWLTADALAADEEGGAAPAGRWLMRGGAAARTGSSRSIPLTDSVRPAWAYDPGKTIEGEPLVWDESIILEVVEGPGRRALHLVRLADGGLIKKTIGYKVSAPLAPCLGRRLVVARTEAQALTVFRIERRRLKRIWGLKLDVPAGEPLVLGREVYFHNGEVLRCYRIARDEPLWEVKGAFHGRLSVRGPDLYVIEYDQDNLGHLVLIDRETGKRRAKVRVAYHQGKRPPPEPLTEIHVGATEVIVRPGTLIRFPGNPAASAVHVPRSVGGRDRRARLGEALITRMCGAPALGPAGCIALHELKEGGRAWAVTRGRSEKGTRVLAAADMHRSLLDAVQPATLSGGVGYLGPLAFDLATLRIHWRCPADRVGRPIPARGALLRVEQGSRLVALKEADAPVGGIDGGKARGPCEKGTAYLRDGTQKSGSFEIVPGEHPRLLRTGPGKKLQSWPLSATLLVVDGGGRPFWRGDEKDVIKVVDRIVDDRLADRYEKLLGRACSSNDALLIERLLGEAWMRGATAKVVRKAERKLETMKTKSLRVNKEVAARVTAEENALLDTTLDSVVASTTCFRPPQDTLAKLDFLRAVLLRSPEHPGAVAAVRKMVPAGMKAAEPFQPLDWVEFLSAIAVIPIEVLEPPAKGCEPTREQKALLAGRGEWRKDLIGIQSERLLILTGLSSPGRIARCLSLGELICDHLDNQYVPIGRKRKDLHRLHIHLFETEKEYVDRCGDNNKSLEAHLKWTSGHYSPKLRLSRIYLRAGAEAFDEVMSVLAHELTHQWMDERCPAYTEEERFLNPQVQPGYWYVEGIATFMEDARYDLARRRVRVDPSASHYVDMLASLLAVKQELIPWDIVFERTHVNIAMTDPRPIRGLVVESYWQLGGAHQLSAVNVFYIQAAAATHYLMHAEGGKYRQAFLRSAAEFHTGRWKKIEIENAYGMPPRKLGRRIEAFARKLRAETAGK